jgi:hypothetical protein
LISGQLESRGSQDAANADFTTPPCLQASWRILLCANTNSSVHRASVVSIAAIAAVKILSLRAGCRARCLCQSVFFFIGWPGLQVLRGRVFSRPRFLVPLFGARGFWRLAGSGHIFFCLHCVASLGTSAPDYADEADKHQREAGSDHENRDCVCPIEAQGFDPYWIAGANRAPWTKD